MPRQPAKAATTQNGTINEKNGSCRPTIFERANTSMPVTWLERGDGDAERTERHRRGVGDQRQAGGVQRAEPKLDQNRAGDGHRRAKPGQPSMNAPKENAMRITWMRGSGVRSARLLRSTSNSSFLTVSW